jgi:hypothetical protein
LIFVSGADTIDTVYKIYQGLDEIEQKDFFERNAKQVEKFNHLIFPLTPSSSLSSTGTNFVSLQWPESVASDQVRNKKNQKCLFCKSELSAVRNLAAKQQNLT